MQQDNISGDGLISLLQRLQPSPLPYARKKETENEMSKQQKQDDSIELEMAVIKTLPPLTQPRPGVYLEMLALEEQERIQVEQDAKIARLIQEEETKQERIDYELTMRIQEEEIHWNREQMARKNSPQPQVRLNPTTNDDRQNVKARSAASPQHCPYFLRPSQETGNVYATDQQPPQATNDLKKINHQNIIVKDEEEKQKHRFNGIADELLGLFQINSPTEQNNSCDDIPKEIAIPSKRRTKSKPKPIPITTTYFPPLASAAPPAPSVLAKTQQQPVRTPVEVILQQRKNVDDPLLNGKTSNVQLELQAEIHKLKQDNANIIQQLENEVTRLKTENKRLQENIESKLTEKEQKHNECALPFDTNHRTSNNNGKNPNEIAIHSDTSRIRDNNGTASIVQDLVSNNNTVVSGTTDASMTTISALAVSQESRKQIRMHASQVLLLAEQAIARSPRHNNIRNNESISNSSNLVVA